MKCRLARRICEGNITLLWNAWVGTAPNTLYEICVVRWICVDKQKIIYELLMFQAKRNLTVNHSCLRWQILACNEHLMALVYWQVSFYVVYQSFICALISLISLIKYFLNSHKNYTERSKKNTKNTINFLLMSDIKDLLEKSSD